MKNKHNIVKEYLYLGEDDKNQLIALADNLVKLSQEDEISSNTSNVIYSCIIELMALHYKQTETLLTLSKAGFYEED